ncbi:uncharacterized protein LOC6563556 [Drosophila grimshawi]|uniref:GH19320 n=1 Tax=Drosophila grimshawi TaxID=7222 RepID=B4JFH1_DROGR|nr:uncharacterized protein LOC6563556 [Drosophila grimshawi]EDV93452.1 GH19320 [Drosophila grimshawi]
MGSHNSKQKKSYTVEQAEARAPTAFVPQSTPAPAPTPVADPAPSVFNTEMVPKWINESQFVEILRENVPQFSKIQSFNVKAAVAAGENYATLMLRVSIQAELTDKTVKPISLMMKVPHDIPGMEQMLEMKNFFDIENEAYLDMLPKLEKLYKSKGLDITFAPRAYKFKESLKTEPKLANTVLMYDLGQDGYKNVNRRECLNVEQTKFVLRKMAQYHAGSATYMSIHGPFSDLLSEGWIVAGDEKAKAMANAMFAPIQKIFLDNLNCYENCEQYREKLEKYFGNMLETLSQISQPDPSEFNVMAHGDCWVNNLLFKFDPNGKMIDMIFVDFQNPRYGHPACDLNYFIMTSVHLDHKLKYFDYFVKYYHDQLIEHLKLLDYKERMPKLMELQMQMYKYGAHAFLASFMVLPMVLLDPTESATFENFLGADDSALNFKKLMYTNKRYKQYVEQILPWLDNRGLLEPYETNTQPIKATTVASTPTATKADVDSIVPDWVTSDYFKDKLKGQIADLKDIQDFRVKKATSAGDNYSSLMLTVDIDYQTLSGKVESTSLMLKIPPGTGPGKSILDLMLTFKKEIAMYKDVIPELEQLYAQAGHPVVFGPKYYQIPNEPDEDRILLQNLRVAGFKNADRLQGLSTEETECVLAKLAQLHAASAQLYVTKGPYVDCLDKSVYNERTRPIFESPINERFKQSCMDALKNIKGSEDYAHKVEKIITNMFELEQKAGIYDPTQFNVMNHGDCWTNNVMFAYGPKGEITDTLFVDFQRSHFNSPACDLYYLLLSSPSFDIKIEKFDYFVRYYHTELKRNLELLKYPRHIPSLRELHNILLANPLPAVTTVAQVMAAVLLDPTDNASMDTMMGDSEESKEFMYKFYNGDRYRKHVEVLYPWLNHKGLLDIVDVTEKCSDDLKLDWLNFQDFSEIIAAKEPQFEKILGGTLALATKPGDNYASKIIQVEIKAQLKDQSTKTYSYILKVQINDEIDENSAFNMFPRELEVYGKYLPAFELLYEKAGLSVTFSPRSYRFNKTIAADYLLMDNLQSDGFKMMDRTNCLDLEHTKSVLKKLAQWHAASLRYKELNGPYPVTYNDGNINDRTRDIFISIFEPNNRAFERVVDEYNGVEEYRHKLDAILENFVDIIIEDGRVDEQEFNVLNHGDLWTNNVMFQHNERGQLQETYLLDHQCPKYGSPALDLLFFLMSSTQLDIKMDKFDYLIRWYHENLIEHAKLLKCTGFLPNLKALHIILLKHPILAAGTVIGTLSLFLEEPTEDPFASDDAILEHRFRNKLYKAQFERLMPWLNKRGLLDIA